MGYESRSSAVAWRALTSLPLRARVRFALEMRRQPVAVYAFKGRFLRWLLKGRRPDRRADVR
jgi:hypothetical protein